MSEYVKEILEDQFQLTINTGVTLIDFYAHWCSPCSMMNPHLDAAAQAVQGKATIVKLDIDKAQQVATTYRVISIPTLLLFKEGKEVGRIVGLRNADDIKAFIYTALNSSNDLPDSKH